MDVLVEWKNPANQQPLQHGKSETAKGTFLAHFNINSFLVFFFKFKFLFDHDNDLPVPTEKGPQKAQIRKISCVPKRAVRQ